MRAFMTMMQHPAPWLFPPMATDFYILLLGDFALSAVLLALFWYVSHASPGLRGVALWGLAHMAYTAGSALLDSAAYQLGDGSARTHAVDWLAGVGNVVACVGVALLACAMVQFIDPRARRGLRGSGYALVALCIAMPLAAWAWPGTLNAQGMALSVAEIIALAVIVVWLDKLDHAPYRFPARLMMVVGALLACLYARDLGYALASAYEPVKGWETLDLNLWFVMNFCMLMLGSFRAAESLRRYALFDPLTNALNRRGLDNELLIASRPTRSRGTAVIVLDLDHFKRVNDRHGHAVGDEVLRRFCEAVRHCIRSSDLLARIGGEEFVVVALDANCDDARLLAERIRREVATLQIDGIAPEKITVSAGVASAGHHAVDDIEELMRDADEAMYEAKRQGRDRVQVRAAAAAAA